MHPAVILFAMTLKIIEVNFAFYMCLKAGTLHACKTANEHAEVLFILVWCNPQPSKFHQWITYRYEVFLFLCFFSYCTLYSVVNAGETERYERIV